MKCDLTENRLLDYLYSELPDEERVEYEKHLDSCGDCRSALEEFRVASKALQTWKIKDPKLNIVFVSQKASLYDRIKDMTPSLSFLRNRPVRSFAYAFGAVFLLLSLTNFQVSYDGEGNSITVSAGMFDTSNSEMDYEVMALQLMQNQSQILELVDQIIVERQKNQSEQFFSQVGVMLEDLVLNLQYQRENDLLNVGKTFIQMYEMADENLKNITDNRAILTSFAQNAGIEIKK